MLVNALTLVLLAGMSDLELALRLKAAALVALNLFALASRSALTARAARVGAIAALTGNVAAITLWFVLAIGCGIEYFNPRCDAVVVPLLTIAVGVGLSSLLVGRGVAVIGHWRSRHLLNR